MIERK